LAHLEQQVRSELLFLLRLFFLPQSFLLIVQLGFLHDSPVVLMVVKLLVVKSGLLLLNLNIKVVLDLLMEAF